MALSVGSNASKSEIEVRDVACSTSFGELCAGDDLALLQSLQVIAREESVQRSNIKMEQRSYAFKLRDRWKLGLAYIDDEVLAERNQKKWDSMDASERERRRRKQDEENEIRNYQDLSQQHREIAERQNAVVRERAKCRKQLEVVESDELLARHTIAKEAQEEFCSLSSNVSEDNPHQGQEDGRLGLQNHLRVFEDIEENYHRNIILKQEDEESCHGWRLHRQLIREVLIPVEVYACGNSSDDDTDSHLMDSVSNSSFVDAAGRALAAAEIAFLVMRKDEAASAAEDIVTFLIDDVVAQVEQSKAEDTFQALMSQSKMVEKLRATVASSTMDSNDLFSITKVTPKKSSLQKTSGGISNESAVSSAAPAEEATRRSDEKEAAHNS